MKPNLVVGTFDRSQPKTDVLGAVCPNDGELVGFKTAGGLRWFCEKCDQTFNPDDAWDCTTIVLLDEDPVIMVRWVGRWLNVDPSLVKIEVKY